MKKILLILLLVSVTFYVSAQNGYQKKYPYDEYNKDWALVKTVSGTYGFVDKSGKAVVPPIYSKIEKFGKYDKDLALVKSISDSYGFIDRQGKIVIPAIYELKEIETNFESIKRKHVK